MKAPSKKKKLAGFKQGLFWVSINTSLRARDIFYELINTLVEPLEKMSAMCHPERA